MKPTIADWHRAWPHRRPIWYEFRSVEPERWVRFHSLPGSKRYADDEAEYEELLGRHLTVLGELARGAGEVFIVTYGWSDSAEVPQHEAELAALVSSEPWTSVLTDFDEDFGATWAHLYLGTIGLDAPALLALLRLVADDQDRMFFFDHSLTWLYAPYDGGGDVVAPSAAERDRLKARHVSWLPTNPFGL